MAFFTDAVAKIFFELLVNIKKVKIAVLNGYVAGEIVDQMIEVQPWNSGGN